MTVSFKTFGCRLNQAETAKHEAVFKFNGVEVVPSGEHCDILVIHSCSVTQKAESECLRVARSVKRKNPDACVVLAGCAVESATEVQLANLGADLIIPREEKEHLAEIILKHLNAGCTTSPAMLSPYFSTHRALLKIQDGCSFFCAYCIIPYNRGAPVSRDFNECLEEARSFIAQGFEEIVITGCNIACYRDNGRTLPDLLQCIAALPGLGRIRLGSVEPATVEIEIAELIASSERICKFLHLPLQNCDDTVLKRMNRKYSTSDMHKVLEQIMELVPDIALGSDLITGFPGESEPAFSRTKTFVEQFPFSNLHVFPYSERRGTAAAEFKEVVDPRIRKQRAQELIAIGTAKRSQYARQWIGRKTDLLIESFDKEGHARGWSGEYIGCKLAGIPEENQKPLLGKIISFTPVAVDGDLLVGRR